MVEKDSSLSSAKVVRLAAGLLIPILKFRRGRKKRTATTSAAEKLTKLRIWLSPMELLGVFIIAGRGIECRKPDGESDLMIRWRRVVNSD